MEPQDKKYYLMIALIALVIVAMLCCIFYWLIHDASKTAPKTTLGQSNLAPLNNGPTDNMDDKLAALYESSAIAKSAYPVSEQAVASSILPHEISNLIPTIAENVVIKVVSFPDATGYRITYTADLLVYQAQQFYVQFQNQNWTVDQGAYTSSAGLVKMQNDQFSVLIENTALDSKNTKTTLTITQK